MTKGDACQVMCHVVANPIRISWMPHLVGASGEDNLSWSSVISNEGYFCSSQSQGIHAKALELLS